VAQFDGVEDAEAAGVPEEYLGLYAHADVWPDDDPGLQERARAYMAACRGLAERMLAWYGRVLGVGAEAFTLGRLPHFRLTVNEYPTWTYGRPDQVAAWRDGTPYVADLAETSAGR
jgi:isopenicillin N synthase-like dioxygenase